MKKGYRANSQATFAYYQAQQANFGLVQGAMNLGKQAWQGGKNLAMQGAQAVDNAALNAGSAMMNPAQNALWKGGNAIMQDGGKVANGVGQRMLNTAQGMQNNAALKRGLAYGAGAVGVGGAGLAGNAMLNRNQQPKQGM